MRAIAPCPNCGGRDQRHRHTSAGTEHRGHTSLLPGLSGWFTAAYMDVVVCLDCGLIRTFASGEAIERLRSSEDWQRL